MELELVEHRVSRIRISTGARLEGQDLYVDPEGIAALVEAEAGIRLARVAAVFYTTAGNATSVENAGRFGKEIAREIRKRHPEKVGVILTAT